MKKTFWLLSILLLIVTCSYFFYYFYTIEKNRKIEEFSAQQKLLANQAVKSFRELFGKWNSVLNYLSKDEHIILMNQRGKYIITGLFDYHKDEIKAITRTDKFGNIIFSIPHSQGTIGKNISQQKHMKDILTHHKPVVSDVFDAVQGYKAVVIHYPVYNNQTFDGTIALLLDFERISKNILEDIKIGQTGYAWLLSKDGIELYCPIPGHVGKSIEETCSGYHELQQLSRKMMEGNSGIMKYTYNKDLKNKGIIKKIAYYRPIKINDNSFWSLSITYSENDITNSLITYRNRLIIILILIFSGGILLASYTLKMLHIIKESEIKKRAEAELEKEKTLLRTLIDNLPSGVFIKDDKYKKIISNKIHTTSVEGHLKHLGLNSDIDILNKTDFEVFPKDRAEKYLEDDKKVIENGESIINQEESGIGPDGNPIWLLISKVPIYDPSGKIIGMVGITTDITSKKKVEEQLILAKEKAEESDRLKTAFLNNISHEIRTPLNAVLGFTQLLNDPEITKDKLSYYTQIISESGNQLLLIISDIINIATIEAGQLTLTESLFPLNSIFPILKEQYRWKAEQKEIQLQYRLGLPDNEDNIYTDYIKLVEILSNLINNALKFTEAGYVNFGYEIKNELVEFYVADSGIGIDQKYQDQIFNRFFQVKDKSIINKGTGLGLSIALAYVTAMGGNIRVDSEPGKGSAFYFTIPYKMKI